MTNICVFFDYDVKVTSSKPIESEEEYIKTMHFINSRKRLFFQNELKNTKPDKIKDLIDFHLRFYKRNNANANIENFIYELKKIELSVLDKYQKDVLLSYIEKFFNPKFEDVFSKDDPLKNYNLMIVNYSNLFLFVSADFNRILKDSKVLGQNGIRKICFWAKKEIELQFVNNYEAFKVLQKKIEDEYSILKSQHQSIIKKNNLNDVRVLPKYSYYFDVVQHLHDFYDEFCKFKGEEKKANKRDVKKDEISTFRDLFYNERYEDISIMVLKELNPPILNTKGEYIGRNKGYITLWVEIMLNYKPEPIIKDVSNTLIAQLLNHKIPNLNLSSNGSEFTKYYKRLEGQNIPLQLLTLFSKFSK